MVDDAFTLIATRLEEARDRQSSIPGGTAERIDAADDVRRLESALGELARMREAAAELVRVELALAEV
jgi:hypothetical protein